MKSFRFFYNPAKFCQIGFLCAFGVFLSLNSLNSAPVDNAGKDAAKHGAKTDGAKIVVTIKPIYSLVKSIADPSQKIALLIDGAGSPHVFSLTPSQVKLINNADLIFLIDPHFETFLNNVLGVLPEGVRKNALAKSARIRLLRKRHGPLWERDRHHGHDDDDDDHDDGHDDDHDDHDDDHDDHDDHDDDDHHDDDDDHGKYDDHDDGFFSFLARKKREKFQRFFGGGRFDWHVWLDPRNAEKMVHAIALELGETYPQYRKDYKKRAKKLVADLRQLDLQIGKQMLPYRHVRFIVFHDGYQYFERRYKLSAMGSITIEPNHPLSAHRLKMMKYRILRSGSRCVFSEPQFSDHAIKTIVSGTHAKMGELDVLGAELDIETFPADKIYVTILENMASSFEKCLGHR